MASAASYGTPPPYKLRSRVSRDTEPGLPLHTAPAAPTYGITTRSQRNNKSVSDGAPEESHRLTVSAVKRMEATASATVEAAATTEKHDMIDSITETMHIPRGVRSDLGNITLLVMLYFIQGLPLGFVYGALPILLADRMGLKEQATLTLATIPYSIKLLWSPIVDTLHLPSIGLRKSWIVPTQFAIGGVFFAIGFLGDELLTWSDTALGITFFLVVFLAATQDIAVDGWALSLLSMPNKPYASTCQSIGLEIGTLLSSSVFIALNSADFCNSYIRLSPSSEGLLSVGQMLIGCGFMYMATTVWLLVFKNEDASEDHHGGDVLSVYRQMWDVIRLPAVRRLAVILLISKIGLIAGESVSGFKLFEKGFKQSDMAVRSLIEFPMHLVLGVLVARWTVGRAPLQLWLSMLFVRVLVAFAMMFVVDAFPKSGEMTFLYFQSLLGISLLSSFAMTVMFVAQGAVFAKVSDPAIGGTYITLLNTLSNFGSSWARYPIMVLVDYFSVASCQPKDASIDISYLGDCTEPAGRHLCKDGGGVCVYESDGYHVMSWVCLVLGVAVVLVVSRLIRTINVDRESDWRVVKRAVA